MKHNKCFIALACVLLVAGVSARRSSQSAPVVVERHGEQLRLSAPGFHFVEGKPLAKLRDGAAVTYVIAAVVEAERGGRRRARNEARFVLSYDLWEEKFSVVEVGPPRRSASHLSRDGVEAWCLDSLSLGVSDVPAEKTFVVKLDCLAPQDTTPPREVFTLSALLEAFSRKTDDAEPHWEAWSSPVRLADLKDKGRH